jgi:hypothetical protein
MDILITDVVCLIQYVCVCVCVCEFKYNSIMTDFPVTVKQFALL